MFGLLFALGWFLAGVFAYTCWQQHKIMQSQQERLNYAFDQLEEKPKRKGVPFGVHQIALVADSIVAKHRIRVDEVFECVTHLGTISDHGYDVVDLIKGIARVEIHPCKIEEWREFLDYKRSKDKG